ncbi:MAG: hypothetical protein E7508_10880 [Ruminococcus sp.]|nr:hypothetical protein [Ruminococcus sp.]
MTIEKLKRYRELKSELEDVNWKLQTVCGSVQGSQEDYPYILQNHHISGIEPKNYKLLERKSDLKAQIKEIEDFVNGIPFYKVRKAVRLYYIEPIDESGNKYTWERIADILNDGSTGDSVRMSVNRCLRNIL